MRYGFSCVRSVRDFPSLDRPECGRSFGVNRESAGRIRVILQGLSRFSMKQPAVYFQEHQTFGRCFGSGLLDAVAMCRGLTDAGPC